MVYSMETWLYSDMNKACRDRDPRKVNTLGPMILGLYKTSSTKYDKLFRGISMDIQDFQ